MADEPEQTHETLAAMLPYLKTANYSLDEMRFKTLCDTPEVKALYEKLCEQIELRIAGTDYKPRYQLVPEMKPAINNEFQPGFMLDWGRPSIPVHMTMTA